MLELLRPVVIAALTALVVYGISALLRAAKPASFSGDGGTIRPERWSAWITIIVGLCMVVLAFWLLLTANDLSALGLAVPAALMGLAIAGFMAPSVTSIHSVHWNEVGIEGPSATFGPTLGTKRTMISWAQIERTGKTSTGYWFVETVDNRRIYWSYLYAGNALLSEAIRRHRPSLRLPGDML